MSYRDFKSSIITLRDNPPRGLSMGLPNFERYIYGIRKRSYHVLFASEGVGKTSFFINSYVCNPIIDAIKKGVDVTVRIYSMEVEALDIKAKIMSWLLYHRLGLITSPAQLLSRVEGFKIDEGLEKNIDFVGPLYDNLISKITIIDMPMNPDQIKKDIENFANTRGVFSIDDLGVTRYTPNNPNEHVILIFDTLGNLDGASSSGTIKPIIDLHSKHSRHLYRNTLGYTVCNVMHSNRGQYDIQRSRFGELGPNKGDIKDSNQPAQDANVVIALFNPNDLANEKNGLTNFMGYQHVRFKDRFRAIYLLKNRDGVNNKRSATMYIGECGTFMPIPAPDRLPEDFYDKLDEIKLSY